MVLLLQRVSLVIYIHILEGVHMLQSGEIIATDFDTVVGQAPLVSMVSPIQVGLCTSVSDIPTQPGCKTCSVRDSCTQSPESCDYSGYRRRQY